MELSKMIRDVAMLIVVAGTGAAIWLLLPEWADNLGWDSSYYLPFMALASFAFGFIQPEKAWLWGIVIVVSQFPLMVKDETSPELGFLFLVWGIGAVFFVSAFLAIGLACVSSFGGFLRDQLSDYMEAR